MSTNSPSPILEVENVGKRFPGVRALHQVSLKVFEGEVLSIVGENGAGKSTLMKILAGVQTPDEGVIRIDGTPTQIESVEQALRLGVSLIHQELNLSGNLTVGANIFLGREPKRFGLIDHETIRVEGAKFLEQVGLDVSPDQLTGDLTIGQQQLVEIAKALSTHARILIMDEPTSSLSQYEADRLYEVIHELRDRGVSILYISHRLTEVQKLSNRVTVLRDGENAGDLQSEQISHDSMVRLMVGRDVSQFFSRVPHETGEVVFEATNVRTLANPKHSIDLSVHSGEIVGLAGLVGAGRTELLCAMFGVDARLSGDVKVAGRQIPPNDPSAAIEAGMGLAPEDRKDQGLIIEMGIRHNISLAGLRRFAKIGGRLNFARENEQSATMIEQLAIKTPSRDQIVMYLSGGNQQKVALGKWLTLNPRILLLDEPTRGIDIGAKQEIYQLMHRLAGEGVGILFVSSEMEEILGVADRVLVMHEGRLTGELNRSELTEESVMNLATGMSETQHEAAT